LCRLGIGDRQATANCVNGRQLPEKDAHLTTLGLIGYASQHSFVFELFWLFQAVGLIPAFGYTGTDMLRDMNQILRESQAYRVYEMWVH